MGRLGHRKKQKDYGTGFPRHKIEALAKALLPTMQAMCEDENIQKEFAERKTALLPVFYFSQTTNPNASPTENICRDRFGFE